MDNEEIVNFQKKMLDQDKQLRRGKNRLAFIVGFAAGLVLKIALGGELPVITWITAPVGMGFLAVFFVFTLKK